MFANRAFNIAFIVSLTWHLVCMFAFNVVVLPGRYKTRDLTSVSFLGPILEETALQIMLVNKPVAVTTRYRHSLKYTHSFDRKDEPLLVNETTDEARRHVSANVEDNISNALGIIFRKDKELPNIVKGIGRRDTHFRGSSGISGAIAEREIIYKPNKPKLPSWITASVPYMVELDFRVSSQGEVKEVVPAVSSGNPEVDLLGIRYLKGWKFAPLTRDRDDEERGRIKLVFEPR